MKISELKDKQGHVDINLKIIWDKSQPEEKFGKKIKAVIVADADSVEGDPTAYLDLYNEDIELYKHGDKIRVTDAYSKLIQNNKEEKQYRLTNVKSIELIESGNNKKNGM